jgi:hypothetical protein
MYVQEARTPLAVGCCVAGTRARAYAFVEAYKKGLADDTRPESIATFCSATTTLVDGYSCPLSARVARYRHRGRCGRALI